MSREVCGTCWCPYDDITGDCACPPPSVQKSTLRAAAQQALEALELPCSRWNGTQSNIVNAAIDTLRAALAEPVQEPRLRYDGLYEYAAKHGLDYNKLCSVVRAALAEPATLDEAMAGPRALAQAYENGWNAAKAEQGEPVAWMDIDSDGNRLSVRQWSEGNSDEVPLYTAPPQRKPLSEEEIDKITVKQWGRDFMVPAAGRAWARAIEAAHGIKP